MSEKAPVVTAIAQRRNQRLREALAYLATHPGGAAKQEILEHVERAVPPQGEDLGLHPGGESKWETAFLWYTSDMVRAGWLTKDGTGHWAITEPGREALAALADADEMRAVAGKAYRDWYNANKGRPRPWLVRGSSVSGHNMVPLWLEDGFVSLPARHLAEVSGPYEKAQLRAAVDEGYASRTSSYRRSIVVTYDRFLGQMAVGDPVLTTDAGHVHVGRIAGEPEWVEDDAVPARLRRAVEWRTSGGGVPVAELPGPLPKRLGMSGEVVDLSEDAELIEVWIEGLSDGSESSDPGPEPVEQPRVLAPLKPADDGLAVGLYLSVGWLDRAIRLLDRRKQVILYGPPGTGKTFVAQALAEHVADEGNVALVQFHPSYAYEDFVMGYRPVTGDSSAEGGTTEGGMVRFALKNGPLMRLAEQARDNAGTPHVLIVDEINRANLAKVFGELYFLLEYRDRAISLLYGEEDGEDFHLPENLFVIGTMNTADRSIALVDAAMRRRFAFLELHPSEPPVSLVLRSWLAAQGHPSLAADLLDALNARIADRDFRIGPSYLMRSWIYSDPDGLETVWLTDLLPLLEEHHAGDGTDVPARYGLSALLRSTGLDRGSPTGASAGGGGLAVGHVLISPSGFGHLEGCPHPGPDPDLTHWGRVEGVDAWPALVAGATLRSAGPNAGLEASRACSDCVGRWNSWRASGAS